ncbi:unnamed protein product [Rodentolepis nana]|uniref:Protein muscleblind n=1 Tax=Rodentolepis nana TaxID=102285 RepID=A0A0R3TNN8_RODNA|nr:unnamed protein product [Rodentolepis nana]
MLERNTFMPEEFYNPIENFFVLVNDCDSTVEVRCSRPPSKHPTHCCACASTASTVIYTVQAHAQTPRQSNSVAPVARQHSQVHARQTSVGAISGTTSGVVLRQHSHQYNPHPHSHHHLSRRDRALMATSMLMNPQHPYHMQEHHAMIPVYHTHFYRQSMPPVVGLSHQRFQVASPVYAALHIH